MTDANDKQHLQQQALGFTPTAGGGDLFDGLSLDYNFLDTPRSENTNGGAKENDLNTTNTGGAMMSMGDDDDPFAFTPRVAHMMASLGGDSTTGEMLVSNDHMLFDHDVASNGISGTPRSTAAAAAVLLNPQQQQQDIPTPLNFSFSPSPVRGGGDAVQRYRTAPQHKHKRVRSNPDVIFSFQQTLHSGLDPVTESMPTTEISSTTTTSVSTGSTLRPSINTVVPARGRTVSNELANAVISSILNDFQDPPPAVGGTLPSTPPMAPIGPVQVMTPAGLNDVRATPIPFNELGGGMQNEDSFKDMDEFLQDLSWAEIPTDGNAMEGITSGTMSGLMRREDQERMIESSPVAYRSQRIQEGVNELKMKRKRPQHGRHHSNPVDLLHNIDQFRILAQQTKQQQQLQQLQQQDPSSVLNSFALPSSNGIVDFQGAAQQFNQFQVPAQIASGAARSLHDRRSSLPNVSGLIVGSTGTAPMPPRAAARRAQRSTGISMDLSQMNLGFLSVPEEEFQQQYQQFQQQQHQQTNGIDSNSKKALAAAAEEEANRKLYKCGRCGQPKVGHVCTMPDQRNNWTQVDLEVTKGLKVMRINCHILPIKSRWVTQDEENLRDEQRTNVRMQ